MVWIVLNVESTKITVVSRRSDHHVFFPLHRLFFFLLVFFIASDAVSSMQTPILNSLQVLLASGLIPANPVPDCVIVNISEM